MTGLLTGTPALAQTSVTNTATVTAPDGVVDSNPDNNSDDALISVTAPLPDFGSCSADMFLSQADGATPPMTLIRFDTSNNPFLFNPLGDSAVLYNGTAFNPQDNYLYGIRTVSNVLVRVGSDGNTEELGAVPGLPVLAGGFSYNAGEIAPDGIYYVKPGGNNNQLYRIDIQANSATLVTLSQSVQVADLAWHNGLLYTVGAFDGPLYSIDPANGNVTTIGNPGLSGTSFGAMFGASNGVFGSDNSGSGFYRFDIATGAATLISNAPGASNNDGAKCATTPLEFPADLSIDKDDGNDTYVPGEDVIYTITVSNLGPFGAAGASVNDPLPAGITTASWACGNATGGATCGVANGTGAIVDVPVNLPAGATVTFSLTLTVPDDFTDDLVNTATVTAPDGSPDPDTSNNTDTDTDTVEPAVVTVEKTSNPAPGATLAAGDTITYTVTTTVAGGPTSDVVTLTDTMSAGLTFGAVTDTGSFSCSGALQCTLPAGTPPGTYALTYTATVASGASGTVSNAVVPTGGDDPTCGTCTTQHPVQPNFGACDATMYLAQNQPTGLFQFDTSSNPFIVDPVGPTSAITYNAIAVNPIDSYIYGLRGPAPGTLVRVGSDGSVLDVGTITGFPINSVIGEFGPDGTYYTGNGTTLYRIDISTMTATAVPLSQTINGQDLAWHDGRLYIAAPDAGLLYAIDPANGNVTPIGSTTVAGAFGGMFGATNGVFGSNNNGGFYRFDLTTGAATLISDLPGSGSNDGAKCATTPLEFPADLAIDKDDGSDTYITGEDVAYTIVVSNLGPFGVAGATVDDPLPAGITTASWTCGSGTGGGVCGTASGSGAISGVPVNLPADASVTFTLTLSVPDDFTGELVNVATVTSPPEGSPDPNPGNNTDDDVDITPVVTVDKSVDPASGDAVAVGDTLTYTVTVEVADSPTVVDEVLTDTLGTGLTVGTLPAGCAANGQVITCTLAAGAAIGVHTFTYTATVNADAETQVENEVVPSTGICGTCTTVNPVDPTIRVGKAVDVGSGTAVAVGDVLTYTLTATVANAPTTEDEPLVDTLGAGLTVGTLPAGCVANGQVITCTLAAGAAIGVHTFTYAATVDADAEVQVENSVVPTNGICDDCTTTNPVDPTIRTNKTVDVGDGTAVSVGDVLTYTLTATVANAATTEAEVMTDTLGTGLTVGTLPAGCVANGQIVTCTLAAGAAIGVHTFTYTATVNADAETQVENNVVPTNGICDDCDTTNPVDPTIRVGKTVDVGDGTAVSVGDILTYTLTATVANASTAEDEPLVDTLGAGLTVGTLPAGCVANGQVITCTLAAGAPIGVHTFTYTATVNADAETQVENSVVPTNGICDDCDTVNPVDPTIRTNKSVDVGDGTAVSVADTLIYTLTVTVANAATAEPEVMTDTLGTGLTVGTLPAGCTASGQVVTCTLAAGAAIGVHTFTYTATVNADAETQVENSVVPTNGICDDCDTVNPVDPTIRTNKSVDVGDGTAVSVGDVLTYTLTVTVANATTTEAEVMTDTLGTGLTVGTLPAGCTASGQVITCTLAAGAAIGVHTFTYTATVNADAETQVENNVVPTNGICDDCDTTNPVDPTIRTNKTVDVGDGTAVSVGDVLTYTLTATVANAATTEAEVMTDTLGTGLTIGALPAGCVANGQVITCTLAAGAAIGVHTFTYTATVNADAETAVENSVVPTNGICDDCDTTNPVDPTIRTNKTVDVGDGAAVAVGDVLTYTLTATVANAATTEPEVMTDTLGTGLTVGTLPAGCAASGQMITCTLAAGAAIGVHTFTYTATVNADAETAVENSVVPTNGICDDCTTTNPVDPTVRVNKSVDPSSGTAVSVADTLTYTLSVTVANAASAEPEVLTDTLGAGLTIGTLPAGCTASGQVVTCTLAAGAAIGVHTFTYTATVNADAETQVENSVVPTNGICDDCDTVNPVDPTIRTNKTVDVGDGAAVAVGDVLTYTLTATVANAATTEPEVMTDTLGTGLTVGTLPAGCAASGQVITCTLAAGAAIGVHTFTYTATVNADAETAVENSVVPTNGICDDCTTTNPVDPTVRVNKSVDPSSGTAVSVADTLTYTLSVTVANAASAEPEVLTDTLGAGLTIGTLPAGCTASGQVVTCTLGAGAAIGVHTFTYTATVNADAETQVENSVVPTNGICETCTTVNPVDPTIRTSKSVDVGDGTTVSVGDTLTYTLTATVANAVTTEPEVMTDTLGTGLTVGTLPAGCTASGQVVTCTLAAGAAIGVHTFTYTATVNTDAETAVENDVVPTNGICDDCGTVNPVDPTIRTNKTVDVGDGTAVSVGDVLTYTLTATVANAVTTEPEVMTDTLGTGLTVGTPPAGCTASGQVITCTLAAGAAIGVHTFTYTATVNENATTQVENDVAPTNGICDDCGTVNPVDPTIRTNKTVDVGDGTAVAVGDTLTYTLTVSVANAVTSEPEVLTDTLGTGLTIGTLPAGCTASGQVVTCTLAAGAAIGAHTFTYTATVDEDAETQVENSVVSSTGECGTCTTVNPLTPRITVNKSVDPESGTEVAAGDTLTYTLTVDVTHAATSEPEVLIDTLGDGLTVGTLPAGCTASGQVITCTLAAGAAIGTHTFEYTATVDADATIEVSNSVEPTNGACETCATTNPVISKVLVSKTANPAAGTEVAVGDVITYTVTATVVNGATSEAVSLSDTLIGSQTLLADSIEVPAGGSCDAVASGLECTLAAGATPGVHTFTYQTQVAPEATDVVGNAVIATGGGGEDPECASCETNHPVAEPVITIAKTSDPGDGAEVSVDDTIAYTLTVTIERAALTMPVTLHDTPGAGLTVGELPAGCSGGSDGIVCEVAAGTVPGVYTFSYPATVNADASGEVSNAVVSEYDGSIEPVCQPCGTAHQLVDETELRIVKTAGVRSARIGDLVRYTLTVENVGTVNLVGGSVVDTPPQGFSYVEGSMAVSDGDNAFDLAPARYPLRIGGLDIAVGEQATIVYLLRVGAGVRHGTQVNSAVAQNGAGNPISNVATAQVTIEADPLLDDSLIFGTVFDDRDGDGWQDNAGLTGVRVQGGFAPGAYIAGSTTLDRGAGHEPVADASAPLLHGIAVGDIAARQSEADPVEARQVVIRQRLAEPTFTSDFVLTSDQGVTVRMDAAGNTSIEKSGEAAEGLNAAAPTVERRVAQGQGGVVVDYVIGNAGIDERGIPGVRIASVEGLLIETDQYGRYHLVDVPGGERGYRNFILKVDPSTLPPGTAFTTENPLVRRITPGIPVRFDFGVQLPAEPIPGGTGVVELTLAEVIFAAGNAEIREAYRPAIARMAEQVDAYGGGEVVITADGGSQALAFERANAVRDALLAQVAPENTAALTVSVRTQVDDALVAGATEGGALLGTVLFDTDKSAIRPEFEPLLDRVAARLEALGGGLVGVVGHTDVRGTHAYNTALGMRRARAVYEALAERLSPEVRARVRVESSNDPAAPVGPEGK